MADFIPITPGTGADVATDEIAGKFHQRVKVQVGVNGFATDVSASNPLPVTDFKAAVQAGLVDGWSIIGAMGEYENAGTTASGEDIWRASNFTPSGPVVMPHPADAGEQMSVKSDSANDTAAGTGARTVHIDYLDAAGVPQTEIVTMNGTTAVDTVATDIRFIQGIHTLTVGSGTNAAGNIGIYKKGGAIATDLYGMIAAGGNFTLAPHRMIPAGKTLLLQGWHAEEAQGKRVAFRIRSTDADGVLIPGVFLFKGGTYINKSATGMIEMSAVIPEFSIIKVSTWSIVGGSEGSTCWWGYLVDN